MKKLLYIALILGGLSVTACGESSKPFTEAETQTQDSIDQINQEDAFDELLNDSTENDSL